jgi:hypothetical protein
VRLVSAPHARTGLGTRGVPKAVLLNVREYLRLAAPEPEVLRVIGEESVRNGTAELTLREIDAIVKAARAQNTRRR